MRRRTRRNACLAAILALTSIGLVAPAAAAPATPGASSFSPLATPASTASRLCPPAAIAVGFSDALDKKVVGGATVGGLSDIAYDPRSRSYVSSVDNHLSDPSRLWFYRDLRSPVLTRPPHRTHHPGRHALHGLTADNEGLAMLPDGDFVVSSETEPSIRIFGRDGRQKSSLPIPPRFRVAPAGEATSNATLEGLSIRPDGRELVAAMEGTLSGDVGAAGDGTYRRFLVYDRGHDGTWRLARQVGYRVEAGNRISEVQFYRSGRVVVMEAAYAPAVGNSISLYAVTGLGRAPDVSAVDDLSTRPDLVVGKQLVADVTHCPTLGAVAKQTQANPLMDNYEGMVIRPIIGPLAAITLISDDNFNATQITRVLNLVAVLP